MRGVRVPPPTGSATATVGALGGGLAPVVVVACALALGAGSDDLLAFALALGVGREELEEVEESR